MRVGCISAVMHTSGLLVNLYIYSIYGCIYGCIYFNVELLILIKICNLFTKTMMLMSSVVQQPP